MQDYVEYGSRVSAPPPVECRKGSFLALAVKGDAEKIGKLVTRVLNVPADRKVEYRAPIDHMLLLVGSFAQIGSGAEGFRDWGTVSETHLSLWVPLAAGHDDGGTFVLDHLALTVPYIFVDNPLSYAGGREDYGYPKAMGCFTPTDGSGPKVELSVFGGDFGRGNQAGWVRLLTILDEADAAPEEAGAAAWRQGDELVPYIEEHESPDALAPFGFSIAKIVAAVLSEAAPQVSLKQVRDAGAADLACYQEIVQAAVKIENLTWRGAGGPWKLEVEAISSHPLAEDLGIAGTLPADLALEVEFDLTLQPGETVAP